MLKHRKSWTEDDQQMNSRCRRSRGSTISAWRPTTAWWRPTTPPKKRSWKHSPANDYACVVIGGGLRHESLLELFENVVNLIRRHAPGAAIAFGGAEDIAEAALRWLR